MELHTKEWLEGVLALFGTFKLTHEVIELFHHVVKTARRLLKD
jgi:hypothetical protein